MNSTLLEQELKDLKSTYLSAFKEIDNSSLFYFLQMIELMYREMSYEVYDKEKLYDLICNNYKNNTSVVFNNMKDYYLKISNNLVNELCKIIKVSMFNKYINSSNLNSVYNNFKLEINTNMHLDNKITVLSTANGNLLLEQIHANCVIVDSKKATAIVNKYVELITEEMIKNVNSKNDVLLNTYKKFVDESLEDAMGDQEKISKMNIKVITNTTYTYLKEQEYFVIEKYINDNLLLIDNFFDKVEIFAKDLGAKKNDNNKLNVLKDYLIGFNNTIRVKAKNIFDEMNLVVTLDKESANNKMKEFGDLISHIYEINIKFDKQFDNYKKEYSLSMHNRDKFDKMYEKECDILTKHIKLNISNIFRDNTSIYNNAIYKSILLKSRINDFTEVLSESKVKDLLLK